MANKMRIHAGDEVRVIAGAAKGRVGKVLRVLPDERKLVVEGVHRVRRHQKPANGTQGGIIEKELPIDASNVALWDANQKRTVKVAYQTEADGKKVRVDRKSRKPVATR